MTLTFARILCALPLRRLEQDGITPDSARALAARYEHLAEAIARGNGKAAYVLFQATDGDERFSAEWEGFWECAASVEPLDVAVSVCREQAQELRLLADGIFPQDAGAWALMAPRKDEERWQTSTHRMQTR